MGVNERRRHAPKRAMQVMALPHEGAWPHCWGSVTVGEGRR